MIESEKNIRVNYYEINNIGGFNITIANYNQFEYPYHSHEFNELVIVFGGTGIHKINDETYNMIAGDVFVLKPNDTHALLKNDNLTFGNLIYSPEKIDILGEDIKKLPGYQSLFQLEPLLRNKPKFSARFRLDSSQLMYVQDFFKTMSGEFVSRHEACESFINALFVQIVVYLCRQYHSFAIENPSPSYDIAKAVSFVESNYHEEITLKQLSLIANVSVNQFLGIFHDTFKMSPMQYLKQLRVSKACTLLRNSQKNITEVATSIGIADSSYFTRVFKSVMGVSPRQYRKQM